MAYHLLIQMFDKKATKHDIPTMQRETWEELYPYAIGASMIAGAVWTRHNSVAGPINHMDFYSDLYHEGSIILANSEQINKFIKIRTK